VVPLGAREPSKSLTSRLPLTSAFERQETVPDDSRRASHSKSKQFTHRLVGYRETSGLWAQRTGCVGTDLSIESNTWDSAAVFCIHYCCNCSICSVNKHCYLLDPAPVTFGVRSGMLAYIASSHFLIARLCRSYASGNVWYTRKLWWSVPLTSRHWHSGSCDVRGFTGCILLGVAASRYNISNKCVFRTEVKVEVICCSLPSQYVV
jgi:hypothetical protein